MTHLSKPCDLQPTEHYERYIRFTPTDFELIDFVFENGELDRVIQTSETFAEDLLPTLQSLGSHAHMLNYIQSRGFEFVELVTYSEQQYQKNRATSIWRGLKRR